MSASSSEALRRLDEILAQLRAGASALRSQAIEALRQLIGSTPAAERAELLRALEATAFAEHDARSLPLAIALYREARTLAADLGDRATHTLVTRRLANCYRDHQLPARAAQLLDECKPGVDATPTDRYNWANASALVCERMADVFGTGKRYDEVVRLFPFLPRPYGNAIYGLSNAASWFAGIGDRAMATRLLRRFRQVASAERSASAAFEISVVEATIAEAAEDLAAADACWQRAYDGAIGSGQTAFLPSVLVERASIRCWQGARPDALAMLSDHIPPASKTSLTSAEIAIAFLAARLTIELRPRDGEARDHAYALLTNALVAESTRGAPDMLWRLLASLAELYDADGADAQAITFGKAAVQRILALEEPIGTGRRAAEALKERIDPHRRLIDRLVVAGRFPEAASVQQSMKHEVVRDFIRRDRDVAHEVPAVPLRSDEEAAVGSLVRQLLSIQRYGTELEQDGVSGEERVRLRSMISAEQRLLREALDEARSKRGGGEGPPGASRNGERGAAIRPGAALLRFLPSRDGWTGLLETSDVVRAFPIEASNADLARRIFDFRLRIETMEANWRESSHRLFATVLGPVSESIEGMDRLSIVVDGPLAYLPFPALFDGTRCLVERMTLSIRSSVAVVAPGRADRRDWRVLLLGPSKPLSQGLRHVAEELRSIASLSGHAASVRPLTVDAIFDGLRERPEIVHIAGHFSLRPGRPELSHLCLDEDRRLSLASLRSPDFDLTGVQLLVLSACETAVRDEGEHGPESLAALAQLKGARSVIGTLWRVGDAASTSLMSRFYGRLFDRDRQLDIAGALRAAQTDLLAETNSADENASRGLGMHKAVGLDHPYSWAGYMVYEPEGPDQ